nr:type II toxin-antitoxin system RelE/ParE family toxin [Pedosphaera parvula]
MVPEIGKESIREIIVRPYRVIYEVAESQQTVAVVRVWHAARGEPEIG